MRWGRLRTIATTHRGGAGRGHENPQCMHIQWTEGFYTRFDVWRAVHFQCMHYVSSERMVWLTIPCKQSKKQQSWTAFWMRGRHGGVTLTLLIGLNLTASCEDCSGDEDADTDGLISTTELKLLSAIRVNEHHVLWPQVPPWPNINSKYSLQPRVHNFLVKMTEILSWEFWSGLIWCIH